MRCFDVSAQHLGTQHIVLLQLWVLLHMTRPQSPRPAVNRCVSILTHRGKKSNAKQMTLERWQKNPEWCRMSVPSLNSVHVLCGFTFSYPAMNFWFCVVTAVSEMLWCFCTASWDPAHCSFAAVSSSAHDEASVTQTCRESMRFDLTHRGKKSNAKQMTLERWQKKSGVMPHVSA